MEFTIKKDDLPLLEMFLFRLDYPCHCAIKINCKDTNEIFEYRTVDIGEHKILITQ